MTKISFIDSTFCAMRGLFRGVIKERNIRLQFFITFVLILIGILSGTSKFYLVIIFVICFIGIVLELLNTGFERLTDLIYPEYNKEVKKFKDEMAGIVVLTFSMASIISFIILYESIINLMGLISKTPFVISLITVNIVLILIIFLAHLIKK